MAKHLIASPQTLTPGEQAQARANLGVGTGGGGSGPAIDDATPSPATVYSSSKVESEITAAIDGLVAAAPSTLDTLKELADALGDDPNYAATVTTALGSRVRTDTAAQGLTGTQQTNARTNINAAAVGDSYLKSEVGDPTTDFVSAFNAALA